MGVMVRLGVMVRVAIGAWLAARAGAWARAWAGAWARVGVMVIIRVGCGVTARVWARATDIVRCLFGSRWASCPGATACEAAYTNLCQGLNEGLRIGVG